MPTRTRPTQTTLRLLYFPTNFAESGEAIRSMIDRGRAESPASIGVYPSTSCTYSCARNITPNWAKAIRVMVTLASAKGLFLKTLRLRSGCFVWVSRKIKRVRVIHEVMRPAITAVSKPVTGIKMITIRRLVIKAALRNPPNQSTGGVLFSIISEERKSMPRISVSSASGAEIAKTDPQSKKVSRIPAIMGATAAPAAETPDQIPMLISLCLDSVKMVVVMERVVG